MKATFLETTGFGAIRENYLPDERYAFVQRALMANPDLGDVMPGCGGLRKYRIPDPARGKGKRSGGRLIYLHIPEAKRFYMIDVYGKDEQADLSADDKKAFAQFAREIKKAAVAQYQKWQEENQS